MQCKTVNFSTLFSVPKIVGYYSFFFSTVTKLGRKGVTFLWKMLAGH